MPRYELDPTNIGVGGFGTVKKGIDTALERRIASKTLDLVMKDATGEDKERFRREAKILAKLTHPNIPAIYDVVFTEVKVHTPDRRDGAVLLPKRASTASTSQDLG